MAGHSKWSKVKRIRGPLDVKRGSAFSKLVKEITVAARIGGGDLSGNPCLRSVAETARTANMPKENIERAIEKGTGELEGAYYEEVLYEGHAPGGVALATRAVTDNKNRTAANLRFILSKNHGSFAASGSVLHQFHERGRITVPRSLTDEERTRDLTLDAGAEEIGSENTLYVVKTPPDRLHAVVKAREDGEDARTVYSHFDIPEDILAKLHV